MIKSFHFLIKDWDFNQEEPDDLHIPPAETQFIYLFKTEIFFFVTEGEKVNGKNRA